MIDIALKPGTKDLDLTNFDLNLVTGIDQIRQNLEIRLSFIRGEWFLDTREGVPYREYIWVKAPNQIQVENFIKECILSTDGINELVTFSSTYDNPSRTFSIEFTCRTDEGILRDQATLNLENINNG